MAGRPTEMTPAAVALQQRLLAAGLLHPVIEPVDEAAEWPSVGFVMPAFDDAGGVSETLQALRSEFAAAPVVVVDDASVRPAPLVRAAEEASSQLVRHDVNRGPAAARNTGMRALPDAVQIVVFVDSDVVPDAGAVQLLLQHFDDPTVTAVAPRIRARSGHSILDRYEAHESPLDLGDSPANVRPGSAVPYVPSTLLAVRREAIETIGGFDEDLRVGEDVDLVWRLIDTGAVVRYEPRAVAHHRNRTSWRALVRQRHAYGTAAASLDRRHPGDVAPIELPPQTLVAWTLAWFGGPLGLLAGLGLSVRDAAKLRGRLVDRVDRPEQETLRLSVMSHAHAGHWLARAVTRAWLPIIALGAPFSRRARRAMVASLVLPGAVAWWQNRPAVDPVTYVVARVADDAAYGSGLWRGMLAERSLRPLLARTAAREPRGD